MFLRFIRAHAGKVGLLLSILMLLQLLPAQWLYAGGGGPTQPEFSMFEPSESASNVDLFSGDFTYNLPLFTVPGPEGSGYPVSLSYHSGESPEAEASWVGFGWTLSPGAVSRSLRGHPDDHNGQALDLFRKSPESHTVSLGVKTGFQAFNMEGTGSTVLGASVGAGYRFNNMTGFSNFYSIGGSYMGLMNANYAVSQGRATFDISADPLAFSAKMLSAYNVNENEKKGIQMPRAAKQAVGGWGHRFGTASFGRNLPSAVSHDFAGTHTDGSVTLQLNGLPAPLSIDAGINGSIDTQVPKSPEKSLKAFGYLYTSSANQGRDLQDFAFENDAAYEYRQMNLPTPFAQADMFQANAEGLGGTFRFYQNKVGSFSVNATNSVTTHGSFGAQVLAGTDFGLGGTVVKAKENLSTLPWNDDRVAFSTEGSLYERVFMRFTSDVAGQMSYASSSGPIIAGMASNPGNNDQEYMPQLPSLIGTKPFEIRKGAATIAYHTNADIATRPELAVMAPAETGTLLNRSDDAIKDGVGEVIAYNNRGQQFVFGLPVYARKEYQLSVSPPAPITGAAPIVHADVFPGNSGNVKDDLNHELDFIQGQYREAPYANAWLLSRITTPDYIDLTHNGPTADDYGGWTKFGYERVVGTTPKSDPTEWFHWRSPYNGFHYSKNDLHNTLDDRLSVAGGQKEIYYLQTIETKTHIARFITEDRDDARSAAPEFLADNNPDASGALAMRRLSRIELYAKGSSELLETIQFEYGYDAFPGQPDSRTRGGKLTLKSVKFFHGGVFDTNPPKYSFGYAYANPLHAGSEAASLYNGLWAALPSQGEQSPAWSIFGVDEWGQHAPAALARANTMLYGSDQRPQTHDPAAWQLKVITSPTGNQTHIQYESDRYRFVQDQAATAMLSLMPNPVDGELDNLYTLNLADWGLPMPCPIETLDQLKKQIEALYLGTGEKIYFRFLYALRGLQPGLDACSEYIEGFADLRAVVIEPVDGANGMLKLRLGKPNNNDQFTPKQLCKAFANTGMLSQAGMSGCSPRGIDTDRGEEEIFSQFAQMITAMSETQICLKFDPARSQIRLPMLDAKRGGGLRVKRLLIYDPGLESNFSSETLNGQEYFYLDRAGKESGVATAEPSQIDKESALYRIFPLAARDFSDRTVGGVLLDQMAGIEGMSVLPSPAVGYGSVFTRDIYHSATNGTGFSHAEFHTARDFPLKVEKTLQSKKHQDFQLSTPVVTVVTPKVWATQGFEYTLNQMHGQPKMSSTHGGEYVPGPAAALDAYTVTWDSIGYFSPTAIPILDQPDGVIKTTALGLEEEIVPAGRIARQRKVGGGADMEFTIAWVGIFPIVYPIPVPQMEVFESVNASHVTTRIRRFPAYAQKTWSLRDGMASEKEVMAYSSITGEPSLVRSQDGYHKTTPGKETSPHAGNFLQYTQLAGAIYPALGQRALKEGRWYKNDADLKVRVIGANLLQMQPISTICSSLVLPERGDRIRVYNSNTSLGDFLVSNANGELLELLPMLPGQAALTQAACTAVAVEILEPVRNNMITATAGNIETYGPANLGFTPASLSTPLTNLVTQLNATLGRAVSARGQRQTTALSAYSGVTLRQDGSVPGSNTCVPIELKSPAVISVTYTVDTSGGTNLRIESAYQSSDKYFKVDLACYTSGGKFGIDSGTGQLMFYTNPKDCVGLPLGGLRFCNDKPLKFTNVLSAVATVWNDTWDDNGQPTVSGFQKGEWARWRAQKDFAYRDATVHNLMASQQHPIYDKAGTVPEILAFNYLETRVNDPSKWLMANEATAFTPAGLPLESKDVLGHYQGSQFGYGGGLPVIQAQNATRNDIWFESFEWLESSNSTQSVFPNGYSVLVARATTDAAVSHSGHKSLVTEANGSFDLPMKMKAVSKPMRISFWVKYQNPTADPQADAATLKFGLSTAPLYHVARVGEWNLLETTFVPSSIANSWYLRSTNPGKVWLDDLRFRPTDCASSAFVYDAANFRLITQYDDSHFGTYFQYDGEGKLVRKSIETERGMKILQESHSFSKNLQR